MNLQDKVEFSKKKAAVVTLWDKQKWTISCVVWDNIRGSGKLGRGISPTGIMWVVSEDQPKGEL